MIGGSRNGDIVIGPNGRLCRRYSMTFAEAAELARKPRTEVTPEDHQEDAMRAAELSNAQKGWERQIGAAVEDALARRAEQGAM